MDNDGDGNGFFNKRDWNGPIAHKGCFIRCNTARAKVHLRWSSIDDISIKVGISVEKWRKRFFSASLVSGVEEQKNGVLRSSLDLITQKWCPSQRLPAVQWRWWCNRFNVLIYTGHRHSSQSLLQFNRGQSWAKSEEGKASYEHCNDFWDRPRPGQGYCAQQQTSQKELRKLKCALCHRRQPWIALFSSSLITLFEFLDRVELFVSGSVIRIRL